MRIFILLVFIITSLVSVSQKIIVIEGDSVNSYPVSEYVYIYKDISRDMSIERMILLDSEKYFTLENSSNINFGFTKDIYWVKFSVINRTERVKNLVFSIDYPLLRSIHFYAIKGASLEKEIITGEQEVFSSRDIKDRTYLFDLDLEPNVQYFYFVRVNSEGTTLRLPMSINTYKSYIKTDNYKIIINGVLIGLLLFSVLFNLFLLVVTKDIINFYYTVFVFLLAFFLINITGLTYQNLWPNMPWWQQHSTTIFAAMSNVFLLLFTKEFFNFKKNYKIVNKISKIVIAFIVISIFLNVFNGTVGLSMLLINILSLVVIFLIFTVSIIGLFNKNKLAIYFLFSFTALVIGTTLYVLRNLGVINSNIIAEGGLKIGFLVEIIFLMFAVIHRYRYLEKRDNKKLERLVSERTRKLVAQKEEIETQRDRILSQHEEVLMQKNLILEKNDEIRDSFNYAKLIQNSVLTPRKELDIILDNYFIVNLPKETLGGDFYWTYEQNGRIYIVVADCTGHGVPGAMMSMLGISALNEIVRKADDIKPSEILNELSVNIQKALHQNGEIGESKDGMDMSICMVDRVTNTMLFAGANNPIYIVRDTEFIIDSSDKIFKLFEFDNNTMLELKADKMSIGYNYNKSNRFNDKKVNLKEGDMIYMFSDGFSDQFGGEKGNKYKLGRFRKLLANNSTLQNSTEQYDVIMTELYNWKKDNEQIDDIIILGLRI